MPGKPLAVVAVALASGILAAAYLSFFVCVLAAVVLLLAVPLIRATEGRAAWLILLAAFLVGAGRYAVSREIPGDDVSRLAGRASGVRGTVISDPETRPDRVRLVVGTDRALVGSRWIKASGKVSLNVYEPAAQDLRLDYGDRMTAHGSVYVPSDPTNPGQYSWREYLARQGIYSCLSIRESGQVRRISRSGGSPAARGALAAKHYVTESIARTHRPEEAALVSGMLLGAYSYLPPDAIADFTRTGTLHILAASGFNCCIVVLIASPLLTFLRILPRRRNIVIILLLIGYLIMVGPKPSLVRATVMCSLFLLGRLLRRVPNAKNLFFVAAIVVLMVRPSDLFDVGFQLSFAGVWALLCVVPVVESLIRNAGWKKTELTAHTSMLPRVFRKVCGGFWGVAVSTAAVSLVTVPLVAHYFNYVSLVSLPANMVVGTAVPFVFADGILAAAFGWMPHVGDAVGLVGTLLARVMLDAVRFLASPRWSSITLASPAPLVLIGYYVVLFGLYDYLRSRHAI